MHKVTLGESRLTQINNTNFLVNKTQEVNMHSLIFCTEKLHIVVVGRLRTLQSRNR